MYKNCRYCNNSYWTTHPKKSFYCNEKCMGEDFKKRMLGSSNPNYKNAGLKTCIRCGFSYSNYNKKSKYCSTECYLTSPAAQRHRESVAKLGGRGFKDANHDVIVCQLLASGYGVFDTSTMGDGFPDIIVLSNSGVFLIEIKNPKSNYGRCGLNKKQKAFFDTWQGQVDKVESFDEILKIIQQ